MATSPSAELLLLVLVLLLVVVEVGACETGGLYAAVPRACCCCCCAALMLSLPGAGEVEERSCTDGLKQLVVRGRRGSLGPFAATRPLAPALACRCCALCMLHWRCFSRRGC